MILVEFHFQVKFENFMEIIIMKKLRVLSVAMLMLSSVFLLSVDASVPTNILPGDTFTYTVSTWDVPWDELISPTEAPFDLADLVFDLSGSTLGVKVMDTYSNGYYLLDFYVVLGKAIEIPLPGRRAVQNKMGGRPAGGVHANQAQPSAGRAARFTFAYRTLSRSRVATLPKGAASAAPPAELPGSDAPPPASERTIQR